MKLTNQGFATAQRQAYRPSGLFRLDGTSRASAYRSELEFCFCCSIVYSLGISSMPYLCESQDAFFG